MNIFLEKYPQVGGGDTGDGKTYWVEHKDVDGSHVSWVKINNKTNKLYVPSKPKPSPPKKRIGDTADWKQTTKGQAHMKHLQNIIAKGKAEGRRMGKNLGQPKKKKKDDGMGGIKIW